MKPRRDSDRRELNEEVRRIWDANAEWWDDRIGEGNALQRELVEPATERLLGDISGAEVLDVACGAGRFARRMAELGASVVAFDFSERFIARARERTAPDVIEVDGKRRLRGATHRTIADRIEAGTFAVAAAITGGDVTLRGAPAEHLPGFIEVLEQVGVEVSGHGEWITVRGAEPGSDAYQAADIETGAYPGLATDLQPPTGVLLTQARGRSTVHETIYEDRLEWLTDLGRMGARAEIIDSHHAIIDGPARLQGAEVEVGDLRAGASLVLGALAAEGQSIIHGVHHVRRGYETLEGKLLDLGAGIEREPEA